MITLMSLINIEFFQVAFFVTTICDQSSMSSLCIVVNGTSNVKVIYPSKKKTTELIHPDFHSHINYGSVLNKKKYLRLSQFINI